MYHGGESVHLSSLYGSGHTSDAQLWLMKLKAHCHLWNELITGSSSWTALQPFCQCHRVTTDYHCPVSQCVEYFFRTFCPRTSYHKYWAAGKEQPESSDHTSRLHCTGTVISIPLRKLYVTSVVPGLLSRTRRTFWRTVYLLTHF